MPIEFFVFSRSPQKVVNKVITPEHAINRLQELCMARHWMLPEYNYPYKSIGPSHMPTFTAVCTLASYTTYGEFFKCICIQS